MREKVIQTVKIGGENFLKIAFLTHFKEWHVGVLPIMLSFLVVEKLTYIDTRHFKEWQRNS